MMVVARFGKPLHNEITVHPATGRSDVASEDAARRLAQSKVRIDHD